MHRKIGGDTDVDVSFQYLKMFFEPDEQKPYTASIFCATRMLDSEVSKPLV